MSLSFSNITPGNFELGPCRVTLGAVDLGGTDKTTLKIEEKLSPIKADQLGDTVIDNRVSGFKMSVETALDEVLLKSNWKAVFRAHKLVGSSQAFYFDSQVGASMVALAQPLILHPLDRPDSDKSADVNIYLATAMPTSEIVQSSTEQQKLKVTFDVYPDFTTTPPRFMLYGDPSVGLVNASAGAATAGTGNTGADTVTGITVNNGATKTEIITLTCVTAGASGKFNVQGSSSGPLGLATVGLQFNAFGNEIGFTINNGSPSAALNDTYTIATTAANYT
jgi:hypothetical protein